MPKKRKTKSSNERPGVLIYFDLEPAIKKLDYTQRGKLLTAIIEYGHYGLLPVFDDPLLEMAWAFTQAAIDRDAESYADKVLESKIAGLTSAFKRTYAPKHGIDPDDEDALQDYIRQRLSASVNDRQPNTETTTTTTTETTTNPSPTANTETAEKKEIRGEKNNELSFEDMRRNGISRLENHLRKEL